MRYPNLKTGLKGTKKISDQITMLTYESREALCAALCRIEEHYESPEFKGRVFTLGQFREWYSKQFGAWSYYKDWSGFNIPSNAFKAFIDGSFDPLSEAEAEVVDLFKYKQGPFCVIGMFEGCDEDVFEHEICHALFATNETYKAEVEEYLSTLDLTDLKKFMKELGYGDNVILDECHAYICESYEFLMEKDINFPEEATEILRDIKQRHSVNVRK